MNSVFFDYFTDDRPARNPIREWYANQDVRVRAGFDGAISLLEVEIAQLEQDDLTMLDSIKQLERDCGGLWEVKIDLKDRRPFRHIRPIGLWHPEERIFIFLGAFEKRGQTTIPPDPCRDALRYKAQYEAGRGVIDEHI
jgi:hypothetical protein